MENEDGDEMSNGDGGIGSAAILFLYAMLSVRHYLFFFKK